MSETSVAQLSPQWSLADDAIYFVGDGDGVANVYRVALASAQTTAHVERLTSVHTGVSGVTPTSPALSVAAAAPVVAYTLYERGRPQLVVFDVATATARTNTMPAPVPSREADGGRRGLARSRRSRQSRSADGLPDITTLGDAGVLVADVARDHRAAVYELGRRTVRHLRAGGRRADVRRHAR